MWVNAPEIAVDAAVHNLPDIRAKKTIKKILSNSRFVWLILQLY